MTNTPATKNVTADQLETLRAEAGAAGDAKQVDLCDRALDGDAAAIDACARAIANAAAQVDASA